ncbi:hypothetical protein C8R44DRAFT_795222, partial [Mycena epipterygia]
FPALNPCPATLARRRWMGWPFSPVFRVLGVFLLNHAGHGVIVDGLSQGLKSAAYARSRATARLCCHSRYIGSSRTGNGRRTPSTSSGHASMGLLAGAWGVASSSPRFVSTSNPSSVSSNPSFAQPLNTSSAQQSITT